MFFLSHTRVAFFAVSCRKAGILVLYPKKGPILMLDFIKAQTACNISKKTYTSGSLGMCFIPGWMLRLKTKEY